VKRQIAILCMVLMARFAGADLNLRQLWSVDLQEGVQIGTIWRDQDDRACALVATRSRVLVVSDREVLWRGPENGMTVTAAARIPYESGAQIVWNAVEPVPRGQNTGWSYLYRYDAETFDSLSRMPLVQYERNQEGMFAEQRNCRFLTATRSMLEDSLQPLYIFNTYVMGFRSEYAYTNGNFYDILGDSLWLRAACGQPIEMKRTSTTDDGRDGIVLAWKSSEWTPENPEYGDYSNGIRHYGRQRSRLRTLAFRPDSDREHSPLFLNLYGMTVAPIDGHECAFVVYSDTIRLWIAEISLPELEIIRRVPFEYSIRHLNALEWFSGDSSGVALIGLEQGRFLAFNARNFRLVGEAFAPGSPADLEVANMDGEDDLELLYLSTTQLICYKVGPVSVPIDSDPIPSGTTRLLSPHPNPFNAFTYVGFDLPAAAPIALRLYDARGQQVRQVLEGLHPAGRHRAVLNADGLPAGEYYLRLTGDRNAGAVGKVIVIR